MGILTRFKDIMSANINALLDKCEDPEKMIDQYMRNLESDLGKVKAETASVMAEEMAGVMPVIWNQPMPSKALSQSMSPGFASAMAESARS